MTSITSPIAKAEMLIRCPVSRVFEAFSNPVETTKFWFTKSSGSVIQGAKLTWQWEMYGAAATVDVLVVDPDQRIIIEWPTPVEWQFSARGQSATLVTITASGFKGTGQEQAAQAIDSMGGFTLVLAGCKAWLEHGLQLNLIHDKNPDHYIHS